MAKSKRDQSTDIINNHIMYAMGFGIIPIPLVDIAAVTAVQLDMVKQLSSLYGQNFNESSGKAFIASVASSTTARIGASFIKALPVIGSIVGGASMSAMSGASTYALGQVCVKHFEADIDLEQINEDRARQMYEEEIKTGEDVANQLKKESERADQKQTNASSAKQETDVYGELLKLGELRDKGLINEAEFQKMKKDIISRF